MLKMTVAGQYVNFCLRHLHPKSTSMLTVVDRPPFRIRSCIDGAFWRSKLLVEDGADQRAPVYGRGQIVLFQGWSNKQYIIASMAEAKSCTLQLMDGERGRLMAEGEYKSMHALYTVAPDMVPEPLGWGTLEANPDGHFFLCEFVNLADEIPDPSLVCKKLAGLHKKSITMSPNGMYGFEVTTCNGTFPQDNRWNDSWEAFFAQQMDGAFKAEEEVQGFCEDYQRLLPPFFEKVIPRLLRPLETGENSLKPALLHGKDTPIEQLGGTDSYFRGSLGRQCVVPRRD
jgi:hypothetical protein